jgi:hypothetical protein
MKSSFKHLLWEQSPLGTAGGPLLGKGDVDFVVVSAKISALPESFWFRRFHKRWSQTQWQNWIEPRQNTLSHPLVDRHGMPTVGYDTPQ